jgi:ribose transport system substrate-binding protein
MKRASKMLLLVLVITMTSGSVFAQSGAKEIAFLPPAMISPYYASCIKGAQPVAQSLGYKLLIASPEKESDYDAQVRLVEDMITRGVKGVILCAINADAIVTAVKKCNAAGIPVVMFNTQDKLAGGKVDSYVRYDQYAGGAKMADFVGQQFNGKANVAIIEGLPSVHTTSRKGGFIDEAKKKYPGIKIVATQPGDWEREKGMNAAANMLQAHPEIDVFFSLCDEMGLGAVKAIEQAGSKAKVVSFDGNPNAIETIKAGSSMLATLSINGIETGKLCVQALDKIIKGQKVDEIINVETVVVTPQNADQYLK